MTLAASSAALAAPGDLDPTFNSTGTLVTPITSTNAQANAVVRQTDGKLVAAGFANVPVVGNPENLDFALVRYDVDGTLDPAFGSGGIVTTAIGPGDDQAQAVIQQTDGKLVAAGLSYDVDFNSTITLVRYLANGTLDPTFGGGTGIVTTMVGDTADVDAANALIQQADLKLVVAGYHGTDLTLVRYALDGSLDTTFNTTGKVTTTVGTMATGNGLLQKSGDGALVVAGAADTDVVLARYDSTGALDATFAGGVVTKAVGSGAVARAIIQQASDGKLVVAGNTDNGSNTDFMLLRYGLDGMPDGGFGTSGVVTTAVGSGNDAAFALAEDNGALVAAGSSKGATNLEFALVRYDATGAPDATFGSGGIVTTPIGTGGDEAEALLIQPNGGIVAAGYSISGGTRAFAVARYLSLPGTTTSTTSTTTTSTIVSTTVTTSTSTTVLPTTTTSSGGTSTSGVGSTSSSTSPSSTSTHVPTTTLVTSTTATVPASTTTTTLVLVPGGPASKMSSDCYLELRVRGAPAAAVQKGQVVLCGEGTSCDLGPAGDGGCDVELTACASQTDPALPDCKPPSSLDSVKLSGALAGSTAGLLAGPACSAPVRVHVPLKTSKAGKFLAGKSKVVIKGSAKAPKGTSPRKDTDKFTIQCVPTAP